MGKEDRGSPVLIFPSNPSASTATAPPQRQRGRCCEDAGEKLPPQREFSPPSEKNTQSVTWSTFALIGLDMSASSLSLPIFLRINFLISYLDSNRLTEHIRLTHTQRASWSWRHRTWRLAVNFDWLHIWFRAGQRWWRSPSVSTQLDVPGGELTLP